MSRCHIWDGPCLMKWVGAGAHHAEDAVPESGGVVQGEAAGEEAGLEEQEHQVLHRLVALVSVSTLPQLLNRGHQK